jgi:hypothetical protein
VKLRRFNLTSPLALSAMATLCWLGTPAMAQNARGQERSAVQENDTTRQELVSFDQFLDSHPRLAEQIHDDPSLVNNNQFVKRHPALRDYLDDHPTVRENIKENPDAFTAREELHARRVDVAARSRDGEFGRAQERDQDQGPTRQQLAEFDRFLDNHQDIAAELRQKPWLATNYEYLQAHPELNTFLNQHSELREQVGKNPSAFVNQDNRFDNAAYRKNLAEFDRFLDKHRDIDKQLQEKPWLVGNYEYLQSHPELKTFLQQHPGLQQPIKQNPEAVISDVQVYDRNGNRAGNAGERDADRERGRDRDRDANRDRDRDTTRRELANFDQFLDKHHEIAEQVRKNPSLVNNDEFVKNHSALQTYLKDHPGVREEVKENPNAFMNQEARNESSEGNGVRDRDVNRDRDKDANRDRDADRDRDKDANRDQDRNADRDRDRDRDANRDRDRDTNRRELANFDQFLDKHHEIAEQVRKNPSLVNNDEFVKNHSALQTYLKDHPGVREEIKENPSSFMNQEARYEHSENNGVRDHGRSRDADRDRDGLHRQFGEFLGGHSSISQQLSKDPSLVKNEEFMANHPELKEYLNSHPDVQQELMKNPQTFVSSSQKFSTGTSGTGTVKSPTTTAAPTTEPKPKQ